MFALVIVVAAVVLGLVAWSSERSREQAAATLATQTEPLLVDATGVYASLSDAGATVTTTFINGGLEPPARRARYLGDLAGATSELSAVSRHVQGSARAARATATIVKALPVYSGLVEDARADNRQGLPVGAAYLRQASALLGNSILPAAGELYAVEAGRFGEDYTSATSGTALAFFVIACVLLLAVVVALQVHLARTTNRRLNIPMLGATVALLVVAIWGVSGLLREQSALATARSRGADAVEVLSAARILALRAQSDESLTLVARDGPNSPDFTWVKGVLMPRAGTSSALRSQLSAVARRTGSSAQASALANDLRRYMAAHARVAALVTRGNFVGALRAEPAETALSTRIDRRLAAWIGSAQRRFEHSASDANSALSGLALGIVLLTALAAVLVLVGLRPRISEYR
jgi:hypothetical protein